AMVHSLLISDVTTSGVPSRPPPEPPRRRRDCVQRSGPRRRRPRRWPRQSYARRRACPGPACSRRACGETRGLPVTRAFLRTPDGSMLDLGTLGGEHSSAAAISEDDGGVVRIAGHSHDDAAAVRAVVWTVRLT